MAITKDYKYLSDKGLDELISLISAKLAKNQLKMQYAEMPSAMSHIGKIVQYVGTTTNEFIRGCFYTSNGLNWSQVNVTSPVVVCETTLPMWALADPGIIYYLKSKNKAYIRDNDIEGGWKSIADSDSTPFIIVNQLPDWQQAVSDKFYILVSQDTATLYIKAVSAGKFHKLSEKQMVQLVSTLPDWGLAESDVVYFIVNNGKLESYMKNDTSQGNWYALVSTVSSFKLVSTLPSWLAADASIMYFVVNESGVTGYIKDTETAGKFFTITSNTNLKINLKKYPESNNYNQDAVYPNSGVELDAGELNVTAFTDSELSQLFEEV